MGYVTQKDVLKRTLNGSGLYHSAADTNKKSIDDWLENCELDKQIRTSIPNKLKLDMDMVIVSAYTDSRRHSKASKKLGESNFIPYEMILVCMEERVEKLANLSSKYGAWREELTQKLEEPLTKTFFHPLKGKNVRRVSKLRERIWHLREEISFHSAYEFFTPGIISEMVGLLNKAETYLANLGSKTNTYQKGNSFGEYVRGCVHTFRRVAEKARQKWIPDKKMRRTG